MIDAREKAKLSWRSRRGMLELDLILQRFIANKIDDLTQKQIKSFDLLLNSTDPELLAWFMGHAEPQQNEFKEIVSIIRTNH